MCVTVQALCEQVVCVTVQALCAQALVNKCVCVTVQALCEQVVCVLQFKRYVNKLCVCYSSSAM